MLYSRWYFRRHLWKPQKEDKNNKKERKKTLGELFSVISKGMSDKGRKTKRKHFKIFSWFRYLTAEALASHRKYTSLTWSWHAGSSRYFIVFLLPSFSETPIGGKGFGGIVIILESESEWNNMGEQLKTYSRTSVNLLPFFLFLCRSVAATTQTSFHGLLYTWGDVATQHCRVALNWKNVIM